jgi:hypothetical protein
MGVLHGAAGVGDAADVSGVPCEDASAFSVGRIVKAPPSDLRERMLPPKEFGGVTNVVMCWASYENWSEIQVLRSIYRT